MLIDELNKIAKHILVSEIDMNSNIYFLSFNNEIVYIGKSVNLFSRISGHLVEDVKMFDKVYYIKVQNSYLNKIELACIRYFQPKLNRTSVVDPTEDDLKIVKSIFNKLPPKLTINKPKIKRPKKSYYRQL